MALQSSGQITLDQIRREYRTGFNESGPISPTSFNSDLRQYYTENYWHKPSPSSTDNKITDFYGSTGQSGYFFSNRRGSSPNYMYGWKEYGGGGFVDPEVGDSSTAMGSATYSSKSRFFSNFHVTGVLIGDYSDGAGGGYGIKLAVWGIDVSVYRSIRAPRTIQFRYGASIVTLDSANRINTDAVSAENGSSTHSFKPVGRVMWIWSNQTGDSTNNSNVTNLYTHFSNSYATGTQIYWRTY